jgi:hypothetical protein
MKKISLLISVLCLIGTVKAQWVQVNNGLGNTRSIYTLTSSGNKIFAGGGYVDGVWATTNYGASWSHTSMTGIIWSLASNGDTIYAGTSANGVFISTDNGSYWTQTSLNNQTVYAFAVAGIYTFAGTLNNGLFYSTNNFSTWTQNYFGPTILSLASSGSNIFAGSSPNHGVYLSTNNGANWTQTSLDTIGVWALAINGNLIFAGCRTNGVYVSSNNGTNWTHTPLNAPALALAIHGNYIFAGGGNGVYLSSDNGANWIQINDGLPSPVTVDAFCISGNYIFAGLGYRSINGVYRRALDSLVTGVNPVSGQIPSQLVLSQNYPNPFNPSTIIKFSLPKSSFVRLTVYDVTGKEVQILVNERLEAGNYEKTFDASGLSSGMYFYKIETDGFRDVKKMVLVK